MAVGCLNVGKLSVSNVTIGKVVSVWASKMFGWI